MSCLLLNLVSNIEILKRCKIIFKHFVCKLQANAAFRDTLQMTPFVVCAIAPSGSLKPLIFRQVVYHLAYLRYFASSSGFRKLLNYFQKNLWNSVFTDSLAFSFPFFFSRFSKNSVKISFPQILWNSVKNQFSTKEFSYPLFHKFCEIQFSTNSMKFCESQFSTTYFQLIWPILRARAYFFVLILSDNFSRSHDFAKKNSLKGSLVIFLRLLKDCLLKMWWCWTGKSNFITSNLLWFVKSGRSLSRTELLASGREGKKVPNFTYCEFMMLLPNEKKGDRNQGHSMMIGIKSIQSSLLWAGRGIFALLAMSRSLSKNNRKYLLSWTKNV